MIAKLICVICIETSLISNFHPSSDLIMNVRTKNQLITALQCIFWWILRQTLYSIIIGFNILIYLTYWILNFMTKKYAESERKTKLENKILFIIIVKVGKHEYMEKMKLSTSEGRCLKRIFREKFDINYSIV